MGRSNFNGETSYDSYFNHPGVPFVFSSGDSGYGTQYPAASPNVTAAGGTTLYVNTDDSYNSETAWSDGGSGCSAYEPKPSFQQDSGCSNRTIADVSADADPNTGALVIYSGNGYQFGGTSLAAPIISSFYAMAGGVGSTLGNSLLYANVNYGNNLHDVTSGSNGSCSPAYLCTAGTGYDGPTGLGTPLGLAAFANGNAPAGKFFKISPPNGAVGQSTNPTLQWGSSSGASYYEYCYSTSNPCTNWINNGTPTSAGLSGLTAGQTYYWDVAAVKGGGTTYSDGSTADWIFTTADQNPGAFGKSSPSNGATVLNPTLQWSASSEASSYQYCYGTTNPCTNWTNNGTSTSVTPVGLTVGQTYYWQVRANNALGTAYADGDPSAVWSFINASTSTLTVQSVGSYDGWILASNPTNSAGGSLNSGSSTLQLGDGAKNRQYKVILSFKTSGLPDTAVIQSATLKIMQSGLTGTSPFTTMGNLWADVRNGFFGSQIGLQVADFSAPASATQVASFPNTPVSGWYSVSLNAAGISNINKTTANGGVTQFRLYFNLASNENNIADYLKFYSGNYGTASMRPQLIITYYIP